MTKVKTRPLWCRNGEHFWNRPMSIRGRLPFNCSEHRKAVVEIEPEPVPELAPLEKARAAKVAHKQTRREQKILAILANRGECTCAIDPAMTDDELVFLPSCSSHWVCPTLDHVRRAVVDWGRHQTDSSDY